MPIDERHLFAAYISGLFNWASFNLIVLFKVERSGRAGGQKDLQLRWASFTAQRFIFHVRILFKRSINCTTTSACKFEIYCFTSCRRVSENQ